jgi:hypothetical protein
MGHSPVAEDRPLNTGLEQLAQKYKLAFQVTEKVALGLIKLSILCLWNRIFGQTKKFTIFCRIMIVVTIAWTVAFFFATLFQCGTHWARNWESMKIFPPKCTNAAALAAAFTSTDVVTNLVIILMPVPIIWRLQMRTKRKVGITAIFGVGLL